MSLFFIPSAFSQENITIATYYPAPFGVYEELRSRRMAIGENYIDSAQFCWPPNNCANQFDANADLMVEGDVGIGGMTSPTWRVQVTDDVTVNPFGQGVAGLKVFNPRTTANNLALFGLQVGPNTWQFRHEGTTAIWGVNNFNILAPNAGSPAFSITTGGNVGIGTTNPQRPLHVNNASSAELITLQRGNIGKRWSFDIDNADFNIVNSTDGNIPITITNGGNVGIGTESPVSKLEIVSSSPVVGSMGFGDMWHDFWYDGGSDSAFPIIHVGPETGYTKFSWKPVGAAERELLRIKNNGSVEVPGTFSVTGTKNFQINHPTKPGKQLVHSTLEGPEAAVFYRGEAQLASGAAIINLPDYFEALTRKDNRTVQLTAKGKEPFLLSCTDVVDGKFSVYGTKPDGKFYWEVKAVRADVKPLEVEVKGE